MFMWFLVNRVLRFSESVDYNCMRVMIDRKNKKVKVKRLSDGTIELTIHWRRKDKDREYWYYEKYNLNPDTGEYHIDRNGKYTFTVN